MTSAANSTLSDEAASLTLLTKSSSSPSLKMSASESNGILCTTFLKAEIASPPTFLVGEEGSIRSGCCLSSSSSSRNRRSYSASGTLGLSLT